MSYSIQYTSDLHLDGSVAFETLLKPVANDLALCGDIGDPFSEIYERFLRWCSRSWSRIFLISGNHEYFNSKGTMKDTEQRIRSLCLNTNIVFLQKEAFFLAEHKIVIIGLTLWSQPDLRRWDQLSSGFIGDPGSRGEYKAIFKPDEYTGALRPLHPSDITQIHLEHREYLKKALNSTWGIVPDGWSVIVLTHHMPTYLLNQNEFRDHPLNSCYASNLDALIKPPIQAWICGHSHSPASLLFGCYVFVTLNPYGYKGQAKEKYSSTASIRF